MDRELLEKFIHEVKNGRKYSYAIVKEKDEQKDVYVQATALYDKGGAVASDCCDISIRTVY